jgi:transcriptional regulator of acetoin/glycerol metabolism
MGRNIHGVTDAAMAVLLRYPFPGNVRELENVLEHAYIVARGPAIAGDDLPPYLVERRRLEPPQRAPRQGLFSDGPEAERQRLVECLQRNFWSVPRAARELGVHRTTLWRKVKRFGIQKP